MFFLGLIASTVMGITLGIMGGGGSILTVPIMVYLFAIPPATATGYSLFVVGMTALIGSLVYIRKGDVDFKTGVAFAAPSIVGVFTSRAVIVPSLPATILDFGTWSLSKDVLIMGAFASLMVTAAYSMIKGRKTGVRERPEHELRGTRLLSVGVLGLLVGIISGFVGAGGGFLIIPALVVIAHLEMRVAVGTSLMIIAVQSLIGFMGDLRHGNAVDWSLLIAVAITAALGIAFGTFVSHRIDEKKLKAAFGWFVLGMGSIILLEQLRHIG